MTLKLNGSTGGSVSIDAPAATTGNADITFSLPVADGSNGQVLQTNGSGQLSFGSGSQWTTTGSDIYYTTGKVGIGTTSPGSYDSRADDLVVQGSGNTGITIATTNTSSITGIHFADGTTPADPYRGSLRYNHSDNSFAYAQGDSERWRTDTNGRLLVGTSSTRTVGWWDTPHVQIDGVDYQKASLLIYNNSNDIYPAVIALGKSRGGAVGSNTIVQSGDELGEITFYGSDGSNEQRGAAIGAFVDGTPGANDMPGRLVFSTTADGASAPSERMRIANDGAVFVAKTGYATGTAGIELQPTGSVYATRDNNLCALFNRLSSDGTLILFQRSTTSVGSITVTSSSTAYNTSSDYRLKENIVPLTGAADRVNQLQVHRFNFIADPDKTVDGFIAHEAQAVVPECVTGTKDEVDADGNPVYQGIDQSKLVPLLTAALQEALAEIESLKARLTALEGGTN